MLHPFGMVMPGRSFSATNEYRYGFNGQERSTEINGSDNLYTAEFWQYDSRLGRRWNLDPKPQPWESHYATFHNNPIFLSDFKGDVPGPGDRAKDYAKKNNIKNYKIGTLKGGGGSSLSWVDREGTAQSMKFLTQRNDLAPNSKNISGNQFQAMAAVDGIQKGAKASNLFENVRAKEIKGTYRCSPIGGYVTDTDVGSADRFNMYVNNSTTLYVDESQLNPFYNFERNMVYQLMTNFVKGTGAENYVFPTDGIISSKFKNSDIVNEAMRRFNAGETIDNVQIGFGLGELAKDYLRNRSFFTITGFVGSASVTIAKQTDKTVLITIFNVTSITSGDLFKNPTNDKNWPKAIIRDGSTPYGNIGQTFSLTLEIK